MSEKKSPASELPPSPELQYLAPYLSQMPPVIARRRVEYFTGGVATSKQLATADSRWKGPKVRQKIGECGAYPTPFLLEYLERQGVKNIVVPQI